LIGREHEDVAQLKKAILDDVERFCDGLPQRDDMCLVCLRRTSSGSETSPNSESKNETSAT
jgi:serine phosphatase RsbU (regulator of sigma subunit)